MEILTESEREGGGERDRETDRQTETELNRDAEIISIRLNESGNLDTQ